jgi:hypothetical protein
MSEKELLSFRSSFPEEFDSLQERFYLRWHKPLVSRVSRCYSSLDFDLCDEIASRTRESYVLEAYREASQGNRRLIDEPESAPALVYRIAHQRALDLLRRKNFENRLFRSTSEVRENSQGEDLPAVELRARESQNPLLLAMAADYGSHLPRFFRTLEERSDGLEFRELRGIAAQSGRLTSAEQFVFVKNFLFENRREDRDDMKRSDYVRLLEPDSRSRGNAAAQARRRIRSKMQAIWLETEREILPTDLAA